MINIESIKTELITDIQACTDYQTLYKNYYVMSSDKVIRQSQELFESRGLSFDSVDFDYFVNNVMYDHESGRNTNQTLDLIRSLQTGAILDDDFVSYSYKEVRSLRDCVSHQLTDKTLSKLINYIPTSLSSSSVGKGEYALLLMAAGASKPKKGGDIHWNGEDIEVKGPGAKMASQSTHIAQSALKTDAIQYIEEITGDKYTDIPNLTNKNVQAFYYSVFGYDWEKVIQFIRYVFRKMMFQAPDSDFDWINESLIDHNLIGDEFDYNAFLRKMAVFEFTYYKKYDKFDRILFLNTDNFNILNTDTMDEKLIEKFRLTRSYSFKGERIQTNYFFLN